MTTKHRDGVADILLRTARQAAQDQDRDAAQGPESPALLDAAWQEGVMRRVRPLGAPMTESGPAGFASRLARLAPAAWAAGGAATAAALVAAWSLPGYGMELAATAVRTHLYGASTLTAFFGI